MGLDEGKEENNQNNMRVEEEDEGGRYWIG
jgi:hypothetical protein